MADVTLEDLQKLYTQISTLQGAVKETNRLLKIQEEYASDAIKGLSDDAITNKNGLKTLDKRLSDLEKKVKK
ncbi:MAG TPA: hypothetical protein VMZ27_08480 [Candidatus Saccharimonadales bacterium]|nr:hypothetical protein [Candidatus Saccharimonadales bacterium]